MDYDFSRKVGLIRLLEKLLEIKPPKIPLGATYMDTHSGRTYIHIGDGQWFRVV